MNAKKAYILKQIKSKRGVFSLKLDKLISKFISKHKSEDPGIKLNVKASNVVGTKSADIKKSHKGATITTGHRDLTIHVCADIPVDKTLGIGPKYMWEICV